MPESQTVYVEPINDYPALLMKWQRKVNPEDIRRAYRTISDALDNTPDSLYVVVDLSENIAMPVKETVTGALFGPYNHRNLKAWLVVGGHSIARVVANTLSQVTRQHKVEWFDSVEDALARLKELHTESESA